MGILSVILSEAKNLNGSLSQILRFAQDDIIKSYTYVYKLRSLKSILGASIWNLISIGSIARAAILANVLRRIHP